MSSKVHQDRGGTQDRRDGAGSGYGGSRASERFSLGYYTCQRPSRKRTATQKGVNKVRFKRDHLQGKLKVSSQDGQTDRHP